MGEFIKRKEAYKAALEKTNNPACPTFIAANVLQSIVDIPAADVEPVRHGHWEEDVRYRASPFGIGCLIRRKCSVCGTLVDQETKYCHNCGAKMDKENGE